jgi:hypothetical protein
MTTFIDGPAKGEVLYLKRAPRFLRVTQNGITFDGLDQLADEPQETELIHVYQITGPIAGIVTTTRGVFPVAQYRFFQPPPPDSHVRQNHAWRGWTTRQAANHPIPS